MNKRDEGASEDFGALLDEFEKKGGGARRTKVAVGDLVRGKVVTVGRDSAFLTLSDGRTEGMIGLEELRDDAGKVTVKPGDELEARVAESGDRPGFVVLRRVVARGAAAREDLQQAFDLKIPVEGTVTVVNKGGVEVNLVGVRAFCPVSQLELRPVEDAGAYVGRKLHFRITKYEEDRRGLNVVVSRRVLLEEEAAVRGAELRSRISVGAVLPGSVVAIKDFGAFVDLGGLEGMLPASELGYVRGVRPDEILSIGQELLVQILRIEKTTDPRRPERISLSLKSLAQDPWDEVVNRFPVGTRVNGKVTRVEQYGAFVELAPGVEGLIHIGELSGGRPARHARDLVKEGEERPVTILGVERERRRISLGAGERADEGDAGDLAAVNRSSSGKLGTFGDLLKRKL